MLLIVRIKFDDRMYKNMFQRKQINEKYPLHVTPFSDVPSRWFLLAVLCCCCYLLFVG